MVGTGSEQPEEQVHGVPRRPATPSTRHRLLHKTRLPHSLKAINKRSAHLNGDLVVCQLGRAGEHRDLEHSFAPKFNTQNGYCGKHNLFRYRFHRHVKQFYPNVLIPLQSPQETTREHVEKNASPSLSYGRHHPHSRIKIALNLPDPLEACCAELRLTRASQTSIHHPFRACGGLTTTNFPGSRPDMLYSEHGAQPQTMPPARRKSRGCRRKGRSQLPSVEDSFPIYFFSTYRNPRRHSFSPKRATTSAPRPARPSRSPDPCRTASSSWACKTKRARPSCPSTSASTSRPRAARRSRTR